MASERKNHKRGSNQTSSRESPQIYSPSIGEAARCYKIPATNKREGGEKEISNKENEGVLMNWWGMRGESHRELWKQTGLKHLFTLCLPIESNGPL